eukprot:6200061-Pleurochrysis_carterae.AAC.1
MQALQRCLHGQHPASLSIHPTSRCAHTPHDRRWWQYWCVWEGGRMECCGGARRTDGRQEALVGPPPALLLDVGHQRVDERIDRALDNLRHRFILQIGANLARNGATP